MESSLLKKREPQRPTNKPRANPCAREGQHVNVSTVTGIRYFYLTTKSRGIDGDNLSMKTHALCITYRKCHHGIYYIVNEGRHITIKK
jgi:hypothetical protein